MFISTEALDNRLPGLSVDCSQVPEDWVCMLLIDDETEDTMICEVLGLVS